jgi:hypothetical protein
MGLYGRIEHTYCASLADQFARSQTFRDWVFVRIGLADWAGRSRSLATEQSAARPTANFWWKNYYCHESRCRCFDGDGRKLAGREIDILLLAERDDGLRFALHVECKHSDDEFSVGQAEGYPLRAACWREGNGGPRTLLRHDFSSTALIRDRAMSRPPAVDHVFDHVIFFDEIAEMIRPYPGMLPQ